MASFQEHSYFHKAVSNSCAIDAILEFFFRALLPFAQATDECKGSLFAQRLLEYYHHRLQIGINRFEGETDAVRNFEKLRDDFRYQVAISKISEDFVPLGRDNAILDNFFTLFEPTIDQDVLNVGHRLTVRCRACGVVQQHMRMHFCLVDPIAVLRLNQFNVADTLPALHCLCGLDGDLVVEGTSLGEVQVFDVSACGIQDDAWPTMTTIDDQTYVLQALVVHRTGQKAGHFFTMVRDDESSWRVYDDCIPSFLTRDVNAFLRARRLTVLFMAFRRCAETVIRIDDSSDVEMSPPIEENLPNVLQVEDDEEVTKSQVSPSATNSASRRVDPCCRKSCCKSDVLASVLSIKKRRSRMGDSSEEEEPINLSDQMIDDDEIDLLPDGKVGNAGVRRSSCNSRSHQRKKRVAHCVKPTSGNKKPLTEPHRRRKNTAKRRKVVRKLFAELPAVSEVEGCSSDPLPIKCANVSTSSAEKSVNQSRSHRRKIVLLPDKRRSGASKQVTSPHRRRMNARQRRTVVRRLFTELPNDGTTNVEAESANKDGANADEISQRRSMPSFAQSLKGKQEKYVAPIINLANLSPSCLDLKMRCANLDDSGSELNRVERAFHRQLKRRQSLGPYLPMGEFDVQVQNLKIRRRLVWLARRAKQAWPARIQRPRTRRELLTLQFLQLRQTARTQLAYAASAIRVAVPIWYRRSKVQARMLRSLTLRFKEQSGIAAWRICSICARLENNGVKANQRYVCAPCKSLSSRLSVSNVKEYMDNFFAPGSAPPELLELTIVERRHVMLLHAFMSLIVLPGTTGQWAQAGQMYTFSADISEMAAELYAVGRTDDLIVVQYEKLDGTLMPVNLNRSGNYLRPSKVLAALKWLKRNNLLYANAIDVKLLQEWHAAVFFNVPSEADLERIAAMERVHIDSTVPIDFVTPNADIRFQLTGTRSADAVRLYKLKKRKGDRFDVCETFTPFEEMCHPHLFPFGKNGLNEQREPKMTASQYYTARLLSSDLRFQQDLIYVFFALNVLHRRFISNQISIALRKGTTSGDDLFASLTAGQLRKPTAEVLKRCFSFLSHLRGSYAYMRQVLYQLLAKVKLLGHPTWFHTVSAADCSVLWPDLFDLLRDPSIDPPTAKMTFKDRVTLLRRNPVLTARFFMRRFKSYVKHFLKSKLEPVGKVKDHFMRVEFQKRGSPHVHMFLWIEGAPNMQTAEGRAELPAFLDRYLSASMPSAKMDPLGYRLVKQLQVHECNAHCTSRYRPCRYGFPHPLIGRTKIAKLRKSMRQTPRFYLLQRLKEEDRRVNPFNMEATKFWKANHDFQFVGSARDVCAYVCSYMMKSEPADMIVEISRRFRQLPKDCTTRQKLSAIGCTILNNRICSAQEAAFLICGQQLPLIMSSRDCVWIPAGFPEKRHRLIRPKSALEAESDDSSEVFAKSIVDIYTDRPSTLETISLAEFGAWYKYSSTASKKAVETLTTKRFIVRRKKEAALRYPRFKLEEDSLEILYSRLLLFTAWRSEDEMDRTNLVASYAAKRGTVESSAFFIKYEKASSALDEYMRSIQESRDFEDEISAERATTKLQRAGVPMNEDQEDVVDYKVYSMELLNSEAPIDDSATAADADMQEWNRCCLYKMEDEEFAQMRRNLSAEQSRLAEEILTAHKDHQQVCLFITGGAGSGKSFLIRYLREALNRQAECSNTLLTAYTGIAAHNIVGQTVHTALALHPSVTKFCGDGLPAPTGDSLDLLRRRMALIDTLVIDEISLLSGPMLEKVDIRLNQVCCDCSQPNNCRFGHCTVLAVGDFYQLQPVAASYCFESWNDLEVGQSRRTVGNGLWNDNFIMRELTSNFRQQTDPPWAALLNRIRLGHVTDDDIAFLRTRCITEDQNLREFPTAIRLLPRRVEVEAYNQERLRRLSKEKPSQMLLAVDYVADTGAIGTPLVRNQDSANSSGSLSDVLQIVEGARIMLTKNILSAKGLVNGQRGIVVGWKKSVNGEVQSIEVLFDLPNVGGQQTRTSDDLRLAMSIKRVEVTFKTKSPPGTYVTRRQFPLMLCWAATIHKVQGQTLREAVIDISNLFAHHQCYVALSRVSTSSGVHLLPFGKMPNSTVSVPVSPLVKPGFLPRITFAINPKVAAYYACSKEKNS